MEWRRILGLYQVGRECYNVRQEKPIIILDDEKIKKTLKIRDVIKVVEGGFRKKGLGLVSLPPKMGPKLPIKGAFADAMSVAVARSKEAKKQRGREDKKLEALGIKWISSFPENIKKNIPVLNSLITLNDPKNGLPMAILKGNWITAVRTGAVSAVSAKYLAPRKKSLTVGIFGLGLQAYVHILAFKAVFKNVKFFLYNHGDEYLKSFLKKFPKEKFQVSKNFHEIVQSSDIVLSVTTFPSKISPYIFAKDLKEDVLILPVDYATRIDPKLYKYLDEIYTDDIPQYELKSQIPYYFPKSAPKIKKEMGHLVARKYKRKKVPRRILVFNLGIALFDILTAKLFIEKTGVRA